MHAPFAFRGSLPPSKSLLIRQLLLQLYQPRIGIPLLSRCDDVVAMQAACAALSRNESGAVNCGEAGLVLRLLLGYVARRGGDHVLTGAPRLFNRPHGPLVAALRTLGATIDEGPGPHLRVRSAGFVKPEQLLELGGALSSQYASSLILNAWQLPFDLQIKCDAAPMSEGYLAMSIDVARAFGMTIEIDRQATAMMMCVPADQQIRIGRCSSEADVSSAFAVAALAAIAGTASIENFPQRSLQPDRAFVEILRRMHVPIELPTSSDGFGLIVGKADRLLPIEVDLGGAPDLFPVLATLCAFADGRSRLYGAPQLRAKESDRIAATATLVESLHRRVVPQDDGMEIFGRPITTTDQHLPRIPLNAGNDHRLVMAAAVAAHAGMPLSVTGLSAVNKSFPELLDLITVKLSYP